MTNGGQCIRWFMPIAVALFVTPLGWAQDAPAALLPPVESAPTPPRSAWLDHPIPRPTPRTGFFSTAPEGPGYYSLFDVVHGNYRDKKPKSAYPPIALWSTPLFEADFRYVDDPKYNPDFLERLHRIHIGNNWLVGTGGQFDWRHVHESSARLTGKTNDFDLVRGRIFGDIWYRDTFRIYAEVISANIMSNDLPPLRNEDDRADMQNLFFQLKLAEIADKPVYVRAGRQEMLFGSQRLIAPPDWSNSRRTFQGVRFMRQGEKFDADVFWVQPIIQEPTRFNSVDHHQNLYGTWFTYRPDKNRTIDLYYLYLDNSNRLETLNLVLAPVSVHTLGSRYVGDKNGFLWDVEGMLQLGTQGSHDLRAGAVSAGLGRQLAKLPMYPTAWLYYDWASGDHTPNSGDFNTFNQLFPQGHSYLGWLDQVGRRNIRDWNAHLFLYPTKWITVHAQYHFFSLDSARDALYNAQGNPNRISPNGSAGGVVGQELDVIFYFHVGKRSDILTGYSKMNAGEFISNTGTGTSPEMWYLMYNVRW